ncbi:PcfJ domain-containing protein [Flavobacterium sp. FlaQc-57]|uniref:PcfJ domain-containing protein n=1 Tax=Flavobacterium sp. FlaQc-57 TaxID=3374186 RepID=UPI003757ACB6
MKPHTTIEKHIVALSQSLAPITPEMQSWAEKNIFLKWGALSRGKFHCLDCGHAWKPQCETKSLKFTKCTSCKGKLKMYQYNQVLFKEIEYSAVVTKASEFQIVRIICSHKLMKKNNLPTFYHKEVMQHWIDPKGEVRTLSLSTNPFSQAYDSWQYYSNLEIRPKDFQNSPKYRINPYRIYPKIKILPILKRNGFKKAFYTIKPQVLLSSLLKDSYTETLLKTTKTRLLRYYLESPDQQIRNNWQAVKICLKNNYTISDFGIWEDYLDLLRWFKKDICSALLICPNDLNGEHDKLVQKKQEVQRKKYLLQMRAEIKEAQILYAEQKKQFFGLCFTQADITITVLENVRQFMEEGDNLRHCVFTNEYFKKNDSLLFSARIDNTPLETIEVSLSKMEVSQCRGLKNKNSKHHKVILNLINRNLYQIRSRMKKQKAEKC